MWIAMLLLLLVGAQVNVSWFASTPAGQQPPPWWVGGRLLWPYVQDAQTLVPQTGWGVLLTVVLAAGAGLLLLLAAAALLRWWVPERWFGPVVVAGAIMSIALQVIHLSVWSVFPLLVAAVLLYVVLGLHWTVSSLRG